jgi:hypothetical protein
LPFIILFHELVVAVAVSSLSLKMHFFFYEKSLTVLIVNFVYFFFACLLVLSKSYFWSRLLHSVQQSALIHGKKTTFMLCETHKGEDCQIERKKNGQKNETTKDKHKLQALAL